MLILPDELKLHFAWQTLCFAQIGNNYFYSCNMCECFYVLASVLPELRIFVGGRKCTRHNSVQKGNSRLGVERRHIVTPHHMHVRTPSLSVEILYYAATWEHPSYCVVVPVVALFQLRQLHRLMCFLCCATSLCFSVHFSWIFYLIGLNC